MHDSILVPAPEPLKTEGERLPSTLDEIKEPVRVELKQFQSYFREAMRSDVGLLDKITQYVLRLKGKRIRPVLVLLSAKTCGQITDQQNGEERSQ